MPGDVQQSRFHCPATGGPLAYRSTQIYGIPGSEPHVCSYIDSAGAWWGSIVKRQSHSRRPAAAEEATPQVCPEGACVASKGVSQTPTLSDTKGRCNPESCSILVPKLRPRDLPLKH